MLNVFLSEKNYNWYAYKNTSNCVSFVNQTVGDFIKINFKNKVDFLTTTNKKKLQKLFS